MQLFLLHIILNLHFSISKLFAINLVDLHFSISKINTLIFHLRLQSPTLIPNISGNAHRKICTMKKIKHLFKTTKEQKRKIYMIQQNLNKSMVKYKDLFHQSRYMNRIHIFFSFYLTTHTQVKPTTSFPSHVNSSISIPISDLTNQDTNNDLFKEISHTCYSTDL